MYTYKPKGVCAQSITFDIIDNLVSNITFKGGCDGNLKGIASLAEGKTCAEVISRLAGITCGQRTTSCPDQLAQALKEISQPETETFK